MNATYSIEQVAERTNLTRGQVMSRMRAKTNTWPHCRPNKRDATTWYFTDADVEAIDELLHRRGIAVDSWGRPRKARAS